MYLQYNMYLQRIPATSLSCTTPPHTPTHTFQCSDQSITGLFLTCLIVLSKENWPQLAICTPLTKLFSAAFQVKIAELPLDSYRLMQTLEWHDSRLEGRPIPIFAASDRNSVVSHSSAASVVALRSSLNGLNLNSVGMLAAVEGFSWALTNRWRVPVIKDASCQRARWKQTSKLT